MSETVSYSTSVSGPAGRSMIRALRDMGITADHSLEWANARDRVARLNDTLAREMARLNPPGSRPARAVEQTHRLEAMMAAFDSIAPFKAAAHSRFAADWQSLGETLSGLKQAVCDRPSDTALAAEAEKAGARLEQIATETQKILCSTEAAVVAETVADTLADLGYRVERRADSLKATCGTTCLWAVTDAMGGLSLDISGHSGLSCIGEMRRVESALEAKGLKLARGACDTHGKPEGGVLARRLFPMFIKAKPTPVHQNRDNSRLQTTRGKGARIR